MPGLGVVLVILPICVVEEGILCTTVSSKEAESPQIALATVISRRTESQLPASGNQFRALEALRATRVSEHSDQGTPLRAAVHSGARGLWELRGFHLHGFDTLTKY